MSKEEPPQLWGVSVLFGAGATVYDPINWASLGVGSVDDQGRLILALPDQLPRLMLVSAKRGEEELWSLFERGSPFAVASDRGPLPVDVATTVTLKLLGGKLLDLYGTLPETEEGQARLRNALAQRSELEAEIRSLFLKGSSDVRLMSAQAEAQRAPSTGAMEKLTDHLFMDSPLKSRVRTLLEEWNRGVFTNLKEGGVPVTPGLWQRGDTRLVPPMVTVGNGRMVAVWDLEVFSRTTEAYLAQDLFRPFNMRLHNANTYKPPSGSLVRSVVAVPPPPPPRIVFTSNRDGNDEIYLMDADGNNQTRLTNDPGSDLYPSWSPDGTKIAFQSLRDGNNEIYAMNADGSNQTRLTVDPGVDRLPSWSPDGTKIAFSSNRDGDDEIYLMGADGSNQTRLTFDPGSDVMPFWSPDGTRIAFTSSRDGNFEIYVMDADGGNPTRLTNDPGADLFPSWSPDGAKIACQSSRDGNFEVYVMDADGGNPTRLTNDPASDLDPSWSPDGTMIAFQTLRDGNFEIYVMGADGLGQTRLTVDPGIDASPDW